MTPDQLAAHLRTMAARIDASSEPSVSKVASDMRLLLARLELPERRVVPAQHGSVDVADDGSYSHAMSRVHGSVRPR